MIVGCVGGGVRVAWPKKRCTLAVSCSCCLGKATAGGADRKSVV